MNTVKGSKLDPHIQEIVELYESGESCNAISKRFGCKGETISNRLRKEGIPLRTLREQALITETLAIDAKALIADYKAGKSVKALAEKFGCSRCVVVDRLERAGIQPRGQSEAMLLRQAQLSPEGRKALLEKAHASNRGRVHSEESRIKYAQSRFERQLGPSPDQIAICQAIKALGVPAVLEFPFGPYNLDVTLDGCPVAVEVNGGGWHLFGRHGTRRKERIEKLLSGGWLLIEVWIYRGTTTPGFSEFDASAVANKVVSLAEFYGRDPAACGQHWMLRGDGHVAPRLASYGYEVPVVDAASRRDEATGRYFGAA